MKIFQNNAALTGLASLKINVEFACPDGHPQYMHIIHPQDISQGKKHPLIVFLQGSGWTRPNKDYEVAQLSQFARAGYVVATIEHRHAKEAPGKLAFLEDTKSAIRYLRAHADEYGIDPERVCMWGTSSGGNTALLVAMTYDTDKYDVGDNLDQSSRVQLVVDTFGPADLHARVLERFNDRENYDPETTFAYLAGGFPGDNLELFREMSPMFYAEPGREYPPMLILNGTADVPVPYEGSLAFYEAMDKAGYDVEFIRVEDAPHEGSFWSTELINEIQDYIERKL